MNPPNPEDEGCSADWEMLQYMPQESRISRHVEHAPNIASAPLPIVPENESSLDRKSSNVVNIKLVYGKKVELRLFPREERLRFLEWEEDDPKQRPPGYSLPCETFQSRVAPANLAAAGDLNKPVPLRDQPQQSTRFKQPQRNAQPPSNTNQPFPNLDQPSSLEGKNPHFNHSKQSLDEFSPHTVRPPLLLDVSKPPLFYDRSVENKYKQPPFYDRHAVNQNKQPQFHDRPAVNESKQPQFHDRFAVNESKQLQFHDRPAVNENKQPQCNDWRAVYGSKQPQIYERPAVNENKQPQCNDWRAVYGSKQPQIYERPAENENKQPQFHDRPAVNESKQPQFHDRFAVNESKQPQFHDRPAVNENKKPQFYDRPAVNENKQPQCNDWRAVYGSKQPQIYERPAENENKQTQFFDRPAVNISKQPQFYERRAMYGSKQTQFHDRPAVNESNLPQFHDRPAVNETNRPQFHDQPAVNESKQPQFHDWPAVNESKHPQSPDRRAVNESSRAQFHDRHAVNENKQPQFHEQPSENESKQPQFHDWPAVNESKHPQSPDRRAVNESSRAQFHDRHAVNENKQPQFHDQPSENESKQTQFYDRRAVNESKQPQFHDRPAANKNKQTQFYDRPAVNESNRPQFHNRRVVNQNKQTQFYDWPAVNESKQPQSHDWHAVNENKQPQFHDRPTENQNKQPQFYDRRAVNESNRPQFHNRRVVNQNKQTQFHDRPAVNESKQPQSHDRPAVNESKQPQLHDRPAVNESQSLPDHSLGETMLLHFHQSTQPKDAPPPSCPQSNTTREMLYDPKNDPPPPFKLLSSDYGTGVKPANDIIPQNDRFHREEGSKQIPDPHNAYYSVDSEFAEIPCPRNSNYCPESNLEGSWDPHYSSNDLESEFADIPCPKNPNFRSEGLQDPFFVSYNSMCRMEKKLNPLILNNVSQRDRQGEQFLDYRPERKCSQMPYPYRYDFRSDENILQESEPNPGTGRNEIPNLQNINYHPEHDFSRITDPRNPNFNREQGRINVPDGRVNNAGRGCGLTLNPHPLSLEYDQRHNLAEMQDARNVCYRKEMPNLRALALRPEQRLDQVQFREFQQDQPSNVWPDYCLERRANPGAFAEFLQDQISAHNCRAERLNRQLLDSQDFYTFPEPDRVPTELPINSRPKSSLAELPNPYLRELCLKRGVVQVREQHPQVCPGNRPVSRNLEFDSESDMYYTPDPWTSEPRTGCGATEMPALYAEFRRDPLWTCEYVTVPVSETPVKFAVRGRGRTAERVKEFPRKDTVIVERRLVSDFGIVTDGGPAFNEPRILVLPCEASQVPSKPETQGNDHKDTAASDITSKDAQSRLVSDFGVVVDVGREDSRNAKGRNSPSLALLPQASQSRLVNDFGIVIDFGQEDLHDTKCRNSPPVALPSQATQSRLVSDFSIVVDVGREDSHDAKGRNSPSVSLPPQSSQSRLVSDFGIVVDVGREDSHNAMGQNSSMPNAGEDATASLEESVPISKSAAGRRDSQEPTVKSAPNAQDFRAERPDARKPEANRILNVQDSRSTAERSKSQKPEAKSMQNEADCHTIVESPKSRKPGEKSAQNAERSESQKPEVKTALNGKGPTPSKLDKEKQRTERRRCVGFGLYVPPPQRNEMKKPEVSGKLILKSPVSDAHRSGGDKNGSSGREKGQRDWKALEKPWDLHSDSEEKLKLGVDVGSRLDAHLKSPSKVGAGGDGIRHTSRRTRKTRAEMSSGPVSVERAATNSIPGKVPSSSKLSPNKSGSNDGDWNEQTTGNTDMKSTEKPKSGGTPKAAEKMDRDTDLMPKSFLREVTEPNINTPHCGIAEPDSGYEKPKFETTAGKCQNKGAVPKPISRVVTRSMERNKKPLDDISREPTPNITKPKIIGTLELTAEECKSRKSGSALTKPIPREKALETKYNINAADGRVVNELPGKVVGLMTNSRLGKPRKKRIRKFTRVRRDKKLLSRRVPENVVNPLRKTGKEMPRPASSSNRGIARVFPLQRKDVPSQNVESGAGTKGSTGKVAEQEPFEPNGRTDELAREPARPTTKSGGQISSSVQPKLEKVVGDSCVPQASERNAADGADSEQQHNVLEASVQEPAGKEQATGPDSGAQTTEGGTDTLKEASKDVSSVKLFPDLDTEHQCLILPAVPQESGALFADLEDLVRFGAKSPSYN